MNDLILSASLKRKLSSITELKVNGTLYRVTTCYKLTDDFNWFTMRGKVITYYPDLEGQQINEDNTWKRAGRKEMKFFDFISKYISFDFYEDDILITSVDTKKKILNRFSEMILNLSKAEETELTYKIAKDEGKSVSEIYHLEMSDHAGDVLKNSCMRADSSHDCHNFAEAYDFINDCTILYGTDANGCLLFRALLWDVLGVEATKDNEGKRPSEIKAECRKMRFLDRIYASEIVEEFLINVANEQGWAYRRTNGGYAHINGVRAYLFADVSDKFIDYVQTEGTPYVDTLYRLDFGKKQLSNIGNCDFELQNADGRYYNENKLVCEYCGDSIDEDDCCFDDDGNPYCQSCFDDLFFICCGCGSVHINADEAIDGYCEGCARENGYFICDDCGEWVSEDDRVYIQDNNTDICQHCYDKGDYFQCEKCQECFSTDNVETIDDCSYCEECAKKVIEEKEKEETEVIFECK